MCPQRTQIARSRGRVPFRIHASYDESIGHVWTYMNINGEISFDGLHWIIDHAETVSERNLKRAHARGSGKLTCILISSIRSGAGEQQSQGMLGS